MSQIWISFFATFVDQWFCPGCTFSCTLYSFYCCQPDRTKGQAKRLLKYKENMMLNLLWIAPNLVRHCGLLSFNTTTKLMCKTPTGFLDSKCLLVAVLIILCNYCCENFFKTVKQLKMEQCDKSKWRSLHFVVAMWFGFFCEKEPRLVNINQNHIS